MHDVFYLWNRIKDNVEEFVRRPNSYVYQDNTYSLAAIQSLFTAEISDSEVIYLTKVYKSKRFNRDSILDVELYYKETETFEF